MTCRRLAEVKPDTYSSLEALGICTLDAGSESNIPGMAQLYRTLGKRTFAMCDKQDDGTRALIEAQVEILLMHEESGFENLVLKGTPEEAIKRFAKLIDWPPHLKTKYPDPELQAADALADYFAWSKGTWGVADFLAQCSEAEIPNWLREASLKLKEACIPAPAAALAAAATADGAGAPGASVDAAH